MRAGFDTKIDRRGSHGMNLMQDIKPLKVSPIKRYKKDGSLVTPPPFQSTNISIQICLTEEIAIRTTLPSAATMEGTITMPATTTASIVRWTKADKWAKAVIKAVVTIETWVKAIKPVAMIKTWAKVNNSLAPYKAAVT